MKDELQMPKHNAAGKGCQPMYSSFIVPRFPSWRLGGHIPLSQYAAQFPQKSSQFSKKSCQFSKKNGFFRGSRQFREEPAAGVLCGETAASTSSQQKAFFCRTFQGLQRQMKKKDAQRFRAAGSGIRVPDPSHAETQSTQRTAL